METLDSGFWSAIHLLLSGDPEVWGIVGRTLWISGTALTISALTGIPAGTLLALRAFRGKRLLQTLVHTGMALPPVVVGLVVYLLLSRSGPFGVLGWLFTPWAMVLAQVILSLPLVVGLTASAVEGVGLDLRRQLWSLGATESQIARAILWEARGGMLVALMAGFGRIVAEVGAVMLVGGNIAGQTRVLTTAIVVETRMGAFDRALALGLVLIAVALLLNGVVIRVNGMLGYISE